MKNLLLYLFFLVNIVNISAQQLPIFTQTDGAQVFINPAHLSDNYLKYNKNMNFHALYRYQWVNLEDAPRTMLGSFDYFDENKRILMSGTISHDQTGPTGFTGLYGRFGYQLEFSRSLSLMLGLSAGMIQYRVKGNELHFLESGDIAAMNQSAFMPDFGLGATMYYRKKRQNYYIGLSVPQTFGLNLSYKNEQNNFNIQRIRHYNAIAGAQFNLNGESWLTASTWLKYVPNTPLHFDVNIQYEYQEKFWVGVGASAPGAAHLETGLIVNPGYGYNYLRIGYGFNHFFATYGPNFGSVHELKLSFALDSY